LEEILMEKNKLAIRLFLASEALFFLLLILVFGIFHGSAGWGKVGSQALDPMRTAIFTAFLLASSVTIGLAHRAWKDKPSRAASIWFAVTILLGLVFLYGQATEWWDLIHRDITVSRDLFGASFFTLTGFHGLHVMIGLVMIGILLAISLSSDAPRMKPSAVDSISLFWHFVDGVWIVIFAVVYLWY
jgi:heme/copper-type cytochrome/quinol oxidase subunit 3